MEICGNGMDDNCDGLADCEDAVACPPGTAPPPEVFGVTADLDKRTFIWTSAPSADRYDAARGILTDLWFDGDPRGAECVAQDLTSNEFTDSEIPTVSEGFYYLVRAEMGDPALCEQGTWGPSRDESVGACP